MTRLIILASLVMDSVNQQYGKESDFFKLEDYAEFCKIFYYEVLQEDFDKTRRDMISLGMLQVGDEVVLNQEWYTDKKIKVKKEGDRFYIETPSRFSFNKDIFGSNIKNIYSSSSCGKFAKITYNQIDSLKFLPESDKTIYFYTLGDKVIFEKVNCGLEEVNVICIADLDEEGDDLNVPDAYLAEIARRTYNYMIQAKNGNVVDKTNNQNPNKILQTEIQP